MTDRHSLTRRFAGFSGLQILSALAPLALLPILARAAGVAGWASLAAGQSVGILVAAFALYGWGVQGPALVAGASPEDRWTIYRSSLVSRGTVLAVTLPVGYALAVVIAADGYTPLTVLMACAQGIGALSPIWFAIGVGQPKVILFYDAGPRIVAVLVSAGALLAGAPLVTYPLLLIAASVGGIAAFTHHQRRAVGGRGYTFRQAREDVRRVLRSQASAAATQIAGASYGSATVAIVGLFATTVATAEFASGDKFYRFTLMVVVAAGNTFQGWVAEHPYPRNRPRMLASLASLGTIGTLGALALAIAGPWATGLLFGSDLSVDRATAVWFGVAFLGICLSTSLGRHILVPLGRASQLFAATLAGALVGLPAIAYLSRAYGAPGGAAGYAVSEVVGALVLVAVLVHRRPSASAAR